MIHNLSYRNYYQILFAALVVLGLSGCGNNAQQPMPVAGNPVAGNAVEEKGGKPGGELIAKNDVPAEAEPDKPAAKTPLIQGLNEVLESNPAIKDDTKDSLKEQLKKADDVLSDVKQQTRAALRDANRQVRVRRNLSPNVVLIVASDLGVQDLGCYGNGDIKTPNIDQFAVQGTRFINFYAGSPNKVDAHWCLATGRRPDEATEWSKSAPVLRSEDVTIAEAMWQAGYTTGLFGDWGVLGTSGPAQPIEQGFDQWLGSYTTLDRPPLFPAVLMHNGKPLNLTKNAGGRPEQLAQDLIVSEAVDWVSKAYTLRPFFLQLYLSLPGPVGVTGDVGEYADKPWPEPVKNRAAAITRLDRDIGKLRQKLSDIKQLGNTIFLITSDTPGRTKLPESNKATQAALRGEPGELYEAGVRVPLIISGTRRAPAGHSCQMISAAWDLAPTIYELVNADKRPVHKAGNSLIPFMRPDSKLPPRFLYWEHQRGTPLIAVRWNNWKAVRTADGKSFELFDLTTDPGETKNIAAQNPDVIAQIQGKLSPAK